MMPELFLTFDTEDFISENVIPALHIILESLKKYNLKALFFITGHMAEKLYNYSATVDLLDEHQIGYHTSAHSVHPAVFEFTDVVNYEDAYKTSLQRETSHINPLTGEIEGKGGIHALKNLFPKKQIVAFRAPGHCWSPPHLEALKTLGITYDFSTNVSLTPVTYKGVTFYPYTTLARWQGKTSDYSLLLFSLRHGTSVLTIHPSQIVNRLEWDLIYLQSNPEKLSRPPDRSRVEASLLFNRLDLLFRRISAIQKLRLIRVTPALEKSKVTLYPTKTSVEHYYQRSIIWSKIHNYEPRFLHKHFLKFFEVNSSN